MRKVIGLATAVLFCTSGMARADFKYTESSKITGGAVAGMMKVAGVFSKKAREPIVTTNYVRGDYLRTDSGDGHVQIIDLAGRRFISLDTNQRTYSVLTFDEMRAALEKLQAKMASKEAEFKLEPKVEITPTGNTKVLLGQEAREVKMRVEMEVEAKDPQKQQEAQQMTFTVSSDAWVASSVKGYEEIQDFYTRMAREMNWLPGVALGGNPQMAKGMMELKKSAAALEGLPLLQYASIGMAGMPPGEAGTGAAAAQPSTEPASAPEPASEKVSSPAGAVTKKLGGLFGGFGRKKKKQEQPAEQTAPSAVAPSASEAAQAERPPSAAGAASLADMTIEVTSFSSDPIDPTLFEIPAGYRQVQQDAEKILGGGQ